MQPMGERGHTRIPHMIQIEDRGTPGCTVPLSNDPAHKQLNCMGCFYNSNRGKDHGIVQENQQEVQVEG